MRCAGLQDRKARWGAAVHARFTVLAGGEARVHLHEATLPALPGTPERPP